MKTPMKGEGEMRLQQFVFSLLSYITYIFSAESYRNETYTHVADQEVTASMTIEKCSKNTNISNARVTAKPDAAVILKSRDSIYTVEIKAATKDIDESDLIKCVLWSSISALRLQRSLNS